MGDDAGNQKKERKKIKTITSKRFDVINNNH